MILDSPRGADVVLLMGKVFESRLALFDCVLTDTSVLKSNERNAMVIFGKIWRLSERNRGGSFWDGISGNKYSYVC